MRYVSTYLPTYLPPSLPKFEVGGLVVDGFTGRGSSDKVVWQAEDMYAVFVLVFGACVCVCVCVCACEFKINIYLDKIIII